MPRLGQGCPGSRLLCLAYVVGFGIMSAGDFAHIPSRTATAGFPPMFTILMMSMMVVVLVAWAVPLIVIIRFLRGATIRQAMRSGSGA